MFRSRSLLHLGERATLASITRALCSYFQATNCALRKRAICCKTLEFGWSFSGTTNDKLYNPKSSPLPQRIQTNLELILTHWQYHSRKVWYTMQWCCRPRIRDTIVDLDFIYKDRKITVCMQLHFSFSINETLEVSSIFFLWRQSHARTN